MQEALKSVGALYETGSSTSSDAARSSSNNRIELAAKKTDPITDVLNNKCGDAKQNNLWNVDASRCSEMRRGGKREK